MKTHCGEEKKQTYVASVTLETYEEAQTSLEMKKVTLFLFILSRSPEDLHEIKSNFEIYNSIDLNDEIDINSFTESFFSLCIKWSKGPTLSGGVNK